MALTTDAVSKIAHLARVAIDDAELEGYRQDLSAILDWVAQLDAVATDHVQPLAHPLEVTQRLRVDQVSEHDQRTTFQAIAPAVEQGLYLVPKVID
ncbi:MAG: Asp-tRNA(Asn)/Glu-tRNA(Gln) amidotransferase subunit GatC [Methylococcales bacterium]|nr:Asp-tRNA(Asn)/Glu-tRNA(Gln) amidotransferase subunit GatC [Methylococcales bacterium]